MAARVSNLFLLIWLLASPCWAQSGLNARQFKKLWRVESESPDYKVSFRGDTAEVLSPKGLTLWRKEKLKADVAVEYDVYHGRGERGRPPERYERVLDGF